jgi:hypothetical protein
VDPNAAFTVALRTITCSNNVFKTKAKGEGHSRRGISAQNAESERAMIGLLQSFTKLGERQVRS